MLKKKSSMISIDRAKAILECYGGHFAAWPERENHALQQLIADSKAFKVLQQEALALDEFMGFSSSQDKHEADWQSVSQCAETILTRLPSQDQPQQSKFYSRPMLALAGMVLVVAGLASSFQLSNKESESLSLTDYMMLYVGGSSATNEELPENVDELEFLAFIEPKIQEDYN